VSYLKLSTTPDDIVRLSRQKTKQSMLALNRDSVRAAETGPTETFSSALH
jgi:hypothetical protein